MDEQPLTAMQVLYVNLVTACTLGIMLAAEPPEPSVMDRAPRRPGKRLLVSHRPLKDSGLGRHPRTP
jgi:magnesium-transporting ATPase (P-type)